MHLLCGCSDAILWLESGLTFDLKIYITRGNTLGVCRLIDKNLRGAAAVTRGC